MSRMSGSRGNKARRNDFISIIAETKELLRKLIPAIQRMPKIDRIEGAGAEMRRAAWDIIDHYHVAWYCEQDRLSEIERMIGAYGRLQAAFEIALLSGLMDAAFQLPIAERMEKIERGVLMWKNSQSAQRQERGNGTVDIKGFGVAASDNVG